MACNLSVEVNKFQLFAWVQPMIIFVAMTL